MKPIEQPSLLDAYRQILSSSSSLIKENEELSDEEEVLDHTEESLVEDIKEVLGDTLDVRSFKEVGVMSNNAGLVVRTPSNKQFQITVKRSK
jgi:hypothetical protein